MKMRHVNIKTIRKRWSDLQFDYGRFVPRSVVVIQHCHIVEFSEADLCGSVWFVNMSKYVNFRLIFKNSISEMFWADAVITIFDAIEDSERRLMSYQNIDIFGHNIPHFLSLGLTYIESLNIGRFNERGSEDLDSLNLYLLMLEDMTYFFCFLKFSNIIYLVLLRKLKIFKLPKIALSTRL